MESINILIGSCGGIFVLFSLCLLLVAILLGFRMAGKLSQPIENLIKSSEKVSKGNFDAKVSEINDMSSSDNVEEWNSLKHIYLVIALEEAFKISFTSDEMVEMLNFKLIKIILKEKLENK